MPEKASVVEVQPMNTAQTKRPSPESKLSEKVPLEKGDVEMAPGTITTFQVESGEFKVDNNYLLLAKFVMEFVAMMLFVIVGCGSAVSTSKTADFGSSGWVVGVAFSFGLAITCLVYTIAHVSGGHINCAVTLGLVISGACGVTEGLVIVLGQVLGSICGAGFLAAIFKPSNDGTGALGSNEVTLGYGKGSAFVGEILMTFLLFFVVAECALRKRLDYKPALQLTGVGFNAPIAIGVAVFLAHMVLIPVDGCSINPTRSFGPLIVASIRGLPDGSRHWEDFWIFLIGPCLGASIAAGVHRLTKIAKNE
mmetsp:Transcript_13822/g.27970  ORF Transcript_13822/g.27970 Transcript_13822/m.27970 type:complete len:308 (-) Transcript_13822:209-1132(-)